MLIISDHDCNVNKMIVSKGRIELPRFGYGPNGLPTSLLRHLLVLAGRGGFEPPSPDLESSSLPIELTDLFLKNKNPASPLGFSLHSLVKSLDKTEGVPAPSVGHPHPPHL